MDNCNRILDEIKGINTKLDRNWNETKENSGDIRSLNQHLRGNGSIGVFERLRTVEESLSTRPQECPLMLKRKSVIGRRAIEVSIMGIILGIIVGLMQVFL